MKKALFLFIVALGFLSASAYAQVVDSLKIYEPKVSKTTIKRMKWEVGTDLKWLIENNENNLPTFLLRKNILEKKKRSFGVRKIGYRWIAQAVFSDTKYDYPNPPTNVLYSYERIRRIVFGVYAGREWQNQLAPRWQFFYGMDAGLGYYNYLQINAYLKSAGLPETKEFYKRINRYEASILPFIGFKFFLHSRVSFSFENSIVLRAYWDHLRITREIEDVLNTTVVEVYRKEDTSFSPSFSGWLWSKFNISFYF